MTLPRAPLLGLLCALAGCNPLEDSETSGLLGVGAFRYLCVEATDSACSDGKITDDFPQAVATGSRFDLAFRAFEGGWVPYITPVSQAFVQVDGDAFRARRHGLVAMLARGEADADAPIADFMHLALQGVSLSVLPERSVLRVDDVVQVVADPGAAGALDYTWAVSDAGVLSVDPEAGTARARLRALAPGRGSVIVTTDGATAEAEIEVLGPDAAVPDPESDAGGDPDAG